MTLWHYRHSGIQIEAQLPLPEWAAFETLPSLNPDLKILWSALPAQFVTTIFNEPSITTEACCFFVPGAAEYRVHRAGMIEICAVPDPDMKKIRVFFYGAAWAAFCYLRELLLLHASAVAIGNRAIAFCGPSGAGKSSLAARMTMIGCPLISDDLFRVDLSSPGCALVYPSSTRLKLWREALANTGIAQDNGAQIHWERDHLRMEKYHVPLSSASALASVFPQDRLPLRAIFVLGWGEMGCTRLTGTAALRRLLGAASYRTDLLEAKEGLARHWSDYAELIRRVPIWELTRPHDWSSMDAAISLALAETSP